jgi:hypothetical protein
MKTLAVFILPGLLLCGCTSREGAEFYALQHQDDHLAMTVSNLQQEVNVLVAQNFALKSQLDTNAMEIALFMSSESNMERNLDDITNGLSLYNGTFEDLSNKLATFKSQEAGDFQKLRRDLLKLQNP